MQTSKITPEFSGGSNIWRFQNAELNEANRELRVGGSVVAIERKPLNVLLCLLQAEGELVTKEELFDFVWAGRIVTDGVLNQAIRRIRKVLGDNSRSLLKTIHGIGFRLDTHIMVEGRNNATPDLGLVVGDDVPNAQEWVLVESISTQTHHHLWKARHKESGEIAVFKFALNERAERALKREVTINRVLRQSVPDKLLQITSWQFEHRPWHIRLPWIEQGSLNLWLSSSIGAASSISARLDVVKQICTATASAHALGILHKDIKPGNVLVEEKAGKANIRLCDFGSGVILNRERFLSGDVTISGFTQTIKSSDSSGTPTYIAPEILAGQGFDERADIYSIGVLLYQMVVGNIRQSVAPGWEQDVEDIGLREIIAAACAGRPEQRIASAQELAERLEQWVPGKTQAPDTQKTRTLLSTPWMAATLLIVVTVFSFSWWTKTLQAPATANNIQQLPAVKRIAALRFTQSISNPEQALPLTGMYDAIVAELSSFSDWELVGINQLDTDATTPKALQALHKRLNIDELIRGSIQQSGESLRLNIQLFDLHKGVSIWGQSFEGDINNLFALQKMASEGLIESLGASPVASSTSKLALDGQAYTDYLSVLAIAESENYFLGSPMAYDQAMNKLDQMLENAPEFDDVYLLAMRLVSAAHFLSRMDRPEAQARITEYQDALRALKPGPAKMALADALILYQLNYRADLAYERLKPYRNELRNRSDFQKLFSLVAWHSGHHDESYQLQRKQLQTNPLDFYTLINWADTLAFGKRPVDAYKLLREAESRMPTNPHIPSLAAIYAFWGGGGRPFLEEAISGDIGQSLNSVRLFEARLDGFYVRQDFRAALDYMDIIPIPMLYTNLHQIFPVPLIRAWILDGMGGPKEEVVSHAQQGWEMMEEARLASDSPGRMAVASTALAFLGRKPEALALARESLAAIEGDNFVNHQVANLVLATLGILKAESEAVALIQQEIKSPLNGDLCGRVFHSIRWHAVRQLPLARKVLQEHCENRHQQAAASIQAFDKAY